jgi:hypothetical protein
MFSPSKDKAPISCILLSPVTSIEKPYNMPLLPADKHIRLKKSKQLPVQQAL